MPFGQLATPPACSNRISCGSALERVKSLLQNEQLHLSAAVSPDHERLFNIGRFARPGQEQSKIRSWVRTSRYASVRLVHVVHNILGRYNQNQVLSDEENHSVLQVLIGNPNGAVLSNRKLAGIDNKVEVLQLMRILNAGHVDVAWQAFHG